MNGLFALVLSMSLAGSVLAAAVLLADRIGRKKTPRRWQYYIWVLVIARLLIPFGPDTTFLAQTFEAIPGQFAAADDQKTAEKTAEDTVPLAAAPSSAAGSAPSAEPQHAVPAADTEVQNPWAFLDYLWIAWVIGTIALLIRKITVYQSFQRYVRAGTKPCDDTELLDRLALAGEECGVRRPIELGVNPLVSSPLLVGLVHPCIVIPDPDISQEDFTYVALHELTHLKHLDIVYKWAVQIAVCVHWFNPLVHYASRRISRLCEFACDEAVIKRTGPDGAVPYGETLLNAMAQSGSYSEPLGSVSLSENKKILKERLSAMKTYGKRISGGAVMAGILTVCLVFATACTGVYRGGLRTPRARSNSTPPAQAQTSAADLECLTLEVQDAGVEVVLSNEDTVRAEYDEDFYSVKIKDRGDNTVEVKCRAARSDVDDRYIRLYVPKKEYDSVALTAEDSWVRCEKIPSGDISGAFAGSAAILGVPDDFEGLLEVSSASGYTELVSDSDFAGMNVTMYGNYISAPSYFEQTGETWTYDDGDNAEISMVVSDGLLRAADSESASIGSVLDLWEEQGGSSAGSRRTVREALRVAAQVAGESAGSWSEAFRNGFSEAFSSELPEITDSLEPTASPSAEGSEPEASPASSETVKMTPSPAASAGRNRDSREESAGGILSQIAHEVGALIGDISSVVSEEVGNAMEDVRSGIRDARSGLRD